MKRLVLKEVSEYLFKKGGHPTVTVANFVISELHDTALFIEKVLRVKLEETKDLRKQLDNVMDQLYRKERHIEELELSDRQEAYAKLKEENEQLSEEAIVLRELVAELEKDRDYYVGLYETECEWSKELEKERDMVVSKNLEIKKENKMLSKSLESVGEDANRFINLAVSEHEIVKKLEKQLTTYKCALVSVTITAVALFALLY